MLATVRVLERDLLVKQTQAGLQRAKPSEGETLGRPTTTTAEQRADILARDKAGAAISELSRLHRVSRATVMRIVQLKRHINIGIIKYVASHATSAY